MTVKQISVFVENRKGRLAEITELLAKNNINIRALSIADTTNFGILRIIVDEPEQVEKILKAANITVSLTSVIMAGMPDRPGGLASMLRILSDADIAVEYMYAFLSRENGQAYVVMRVDNEEKAVSLLSKNDYKGL